MNQLTTRQAGILMFFSIIALKLITFPALYAKYCGVNGYLAVAFNMALDLIILGVLMWISKHHPTDKIKDFLMRYLGKAGTHILLFLMFIFFFFKSAYLLKELHHYLLNTLFNNLNFLYFLIPIILVASFIMSKSLRALGRSAEIFFPLVLFTLVFTLIIPYGYVDIANLLPFMENGVHPILDASMHCSFSTGDFFIFFIIMGNVKLEKNSYKKIFNYALSATIFVVVFYIVFFAVYGDLGYLSIVAVGDLPFFSSFPSSVGRVDWITINLWMIAVIFQTGVFLHCGVTCFNQTFNFKHKTSGLVIIISLMVGFLFAYYLNLTILIEQITSYWFSVINILLQTGLFLSIFAGFIFQKKRGPFDVQKVFSK